MLAGHDTESMEWAEEDGWRRHKEEEGGGLGRDARSQGRRRWMGQQDDSGRHEGTMTMVGRSWHDWTTRARGAERGGGAGGWAGITVYGEFIKLRSHPSLKYGMHLSTLVLFLSVMIVSSLMGFLALVGDGRLVDGWLGY